MKNVIQRRLPLNTKYVVTDKKYIPLLEGFGTCCDNCGKLIANIATVKNETGQSFYVGFDCLETFLINNELVSESDQESYEATKKMIPKILRFSKEIDELIKINKGIDGLIFEKPTHKTDWVTYWLIKGNAKPYNMAIKLKEMNFDFLIITLKAIFPKLNITTK